MLPVNHKIARQNMEDGVLASTIYSRVDSKNCKNHMEIDFLISKNNKICPIEVKSSGYKEHSSLDKFRKKFGNKLGDSYILYAKDVMVKNDVIHLPLYMAMFYDNH